jgi:uncharacterized protein DUF3891
MIIQSAPAGQPALAVMMHEHTALAGQFARAFGNDRFAPIEPFDPMVYVISHHDAGWAAFDRDPVTDPATGLPYNLVETPAEHITRTSALSPAFNQRQHPYSGLLSSMHSWGLYNGRYGTSNMVLIDRIPQHDRPLADRMLEGELARQGKLKAEIAQDPEGAAWLDEAHVFQNYKQLQFCDLLALYFNRTHAGARAEQTIAHVPLNAREDAGITIRPHQDGVYQLSPFPLAADGAEFAYAGRLIEPRQHERQGGWPAVLKAAPTVWERFRLVA